MYERLHSTYRLYMLLSVCLYVCMAVCLSLSLSRPLLVLFLFTRPFPLLSLSFPAAWVLTSLCNICLPEALIIIIIMIIKTIYMVPSHNIPVTRVPRNQMFRWLCVCMCSICVNVVCMYAYMYVRVHAFFICVCYFSHHSVNLYSASSFSYLHQSK